MPQRRRGGDRMDIKEYYPIHLRVGILITLVGFILAFLLVPKTEVKAYKPNFTPTVKVEKLPPQLKNIVEPPPPPKPKLPVAAQSDEEVQQETIEKTDFTGFEKESDVDLPPPDFVPYDRAPQPINLEQVKNMVEYPEIARKLGIEGRVWLKLWVDKEGNVRKVIVTKGVYPALDEAAKKAYKHLKFHPAMQRDKPVAVWVTMYFDFRLTQ